MSTIKDVARLAGVSLGTVSNVLNGKKTVAPEKERRVQQAIEELNYKPHQSARSLKTSRTMNIAVVLPDILDAMKANLFTGIERVLSQEGYAVNLYTTSEMPAKETAILESILQQRADGIIISTCQPENAELFRELKQSDASVVLVERAVYCEDFPLVEFDNNESVFKLTSELTKENSRKIVLICGNEKFSSESSCRDAFLRAVNENDNGNIDGTVIYSGFNKESAFRNITSYLQKQDSLPDCIITTGTPLMNGVKKAIEMQAKAESSLPRLYTLSEENWAETSDSDVFRISRRPIALGETAAELLLSEIGNERPADIKTVKIRNISYSPVKKAGETLRSGIQKVKVLMLDSPAYRALSNLLPDYEKKYGASAEFTALPYDELIAVIEDENRRASYDVLQLDIPWIPDLVQGGALLDLKAYDPDVEKISEKFVPGVLSAYSRFNGSIFAFPFMFGTQLLYYRKDLFEDTAVKLNFRERYGFELEVPKTWSEYNIVAEFFTKEHNPCSPVEYGTTLGGKMFSGAVCEFLPRLWAYGGTLLDSSGQINTDKAAFLKSLNVYRDSFKYAHPDSAGFWWNEQIREFREGRAAMMIMFIAHATELADDLDTDIQGRIGYDVIPGGIPMLGGWSIGINSSTDNAAEAFNFINWATSKDLAIPQTILGGSTASISLYRSSELLTIYPWLPKALQSFKNSRKRDISRNTTRGRLAEKDFELILGKAVHEAVAGDITTEQAVEQTLDEMGKLL